MKIVTVLVHRTWDRLVIYWHTLVCFEQTYEKYHFFYLKSFSFWRWNFLYIWIVVFYECLPSKYSNVRKFTFGYKHTSKISLNTVQYDKSLLASLWIAKDQTWSDSIDEQADWILSCAHKYKSTFSTLRLVCLIKQYCWKLAMVNVLKFSTPKYMYHIRWHMSTVQTLIRLLLNQNVSQNGTCKQSRPRSDCSWRSSLIRVYIVCHSTQFFKMNCIKSKI